MAVRKPASAAPTFGPLCPAVLEHLAIVGSISADVRPRPFVCATNLGLRIGWHCNQVDIEIHIEPKGWRFWASQMHDDLVETYGGASSDVLRVFLKKLSRGNDNQEANPNDA